MSGSAVSRVIETKTIGGPAELRGVGTDGEMTMVGSGAEIVSGTEPGSDVPSLFTALPNDVHVTLRFQGPKLSVTDQFKSFGGAP
jgi:hypothetical protein